MATLHDKIDILPWPPGAPPCAALVYVVGATNAAECPARSEPIAARGDCEAAAASIDVPFGGIMEVRASSVHEALRALRPPYSCLRGACPLPHRLQDDTRPKNCHFSELDERVYFNRVVKGEGRDRVHKFLALLTEAAGDP